MQRLFRLLVVVSIVLCFGSCAKSPEAVDYTALATDLTALHGKENAPALLEQHSDYLDAYTYDTLQDTAIPKWQFAIDFMRTETYTPPLEVKIVNSYIHKDAYLYEGTVYNPDIPRSTFWFRTTFRVDKGLIVDWRSEVYDTSPAKIGGLS